MISSAMLNSHIRQHRLERTKYQKLYDYYIGKHEILNRTLPDPTKPNNKIVAAYPTRIINTVVSYLISKPISYLSKSGDDTYLKELLNIFHLNDEEDVNAELVKLFSIFGKCYELMWVDKKGDIRFKQYSPLEMFVEQDAHGNIKFALRHWEEKDVDGNVTIKGELYDDEGIHYFISSDGENYTKDPDEESKEHYFGEVPVNVYLNSEEGLGDFEQFIPLIDAMDKLLSDSENELESFANAYLKLKGYQGSSKEDILKLKQEGVLLLDENGDADWLVKNVNNQFQQNFFETIDNLIHEQSDTPKLTSEKFSSNLSGIALGYKLSGLNSKCGVKERKMSKSLRKRIRLITTILNKKGRSYVPSDISFTFTRNVPQDESTITDEMVKLVNMVPTETLLSWHPRIQDPVETYKRLKEQEDAMNLDNIGEKNNGK